MAMGEGDFVRLDPRRLGADLGGHVAQRQPFRQRHVRDRFAAELDHLVHAVIRSERADDVQNRVLGEHAFARRTVEDDFYHFGHAEPQLPGDQDRGHVGGTDAGPERPQRAVSGGVRVGDHHQAPGARKSLVHADLVADAFVHVHEVGDVLRVAEFAELFLVVGLLDRRGRRVVVEEHHHVLRRMDCDAADLEKRAHGLQIQVVAQRRD